jgi:hypothetical protein
MENTTGFRFVQVSGGHLMLALEGVEQQDVDLWTVESAVTRVELPRPSGRVQRARQLGFSFVPRRNLSQVILGPRRKEKFVLKTENVVSKPQALFHATTQRRSCPSARAREHAHVVDEVQTAHNLRLKLVAAAEDVGIILHEAAHAREASEGAAELVAVQDAKLCESKRHFAVGTALGAEHEAVARAVHGLEGVSGRMLQ